MSREKLILGIIAYKIESTLWECSDFLNPLSSLFFLQKASENMILSFTMWIVNDWRVERKVFTRKIEGLSVSLG